MAVRPESGGTGRPAGAVPSSAGPDARGDGLSSWCEALETAYPPEDAESWDAIGLHVGDLATDRVTGVLVTLDVTESVLAEAASLGADLIVAHHPLLFSPLERLTGCDRTRPPRPCGRPTGLCDRGSTHQRRRRR